jgi:hypothetical protein
MVRAVRVAACAAQVGCVATARADVHLRYRRAYGKPASEVYIHAGKLRMERAGPHGTNQDTQAADVVVSRSCAALGKALGLSARTWPSSRHSPTSPVSSCRAWGRGSIADARGIPVETTREYGRQTEELTAVSHDSLPDTTFSVPAGCTQRKLME